MFHNVFYTTLGIIQWSLTEVAIIHCYRTGQLSFTPLSSTSSSLEKTVFAIWCLTIPIIREVHFYFCHRILHSRFLYKYVHAVHHRSSDTEPFSGLCMHPVEHLYYFACYGPLIWFSSGHHPFLFWWMGFHALISPGASHSGYEDHWGADVYHYLHHRYFECNYGTPGIPFDKWFGSFRDKLDSSEAKTVGSRSVDTKASLVGFPEHLEYSVLIVLVPALSLWYYIRIEKGTQTWMMALYLSISPILIAACLHLLQRPRLQAITIFKHYFSPLHDSTALVHTLHLVVGVGLCSALPVASFLYLVLESL